MKAAAVMTGGAPVAPNVELIDLPTPSPGPGEVRVRTEASGLNHLDVWVGMGIPGVDRPWPRVTGSDGVGIVDAVGDGVDDVWVGRRVIMNAAHDLNSEDRSDGRPAGEQFHLVGEQSPGAMAEAFVVRVTNVMDIGEADPIEAAAFGLTHLTAWRMLTTRAGARAGDWVLIPGIGGGVALAALGICRYLGCRTIVTSRSAEKLQRASELGASVWHPRRRQRLESGRSGCDRRRWGRHLHRLNREGRSSLLHQVAGARWADFVTCGCTSGPGAETDLARIFWNQLSILGSTMGDMREFQEVVSLFLKGSLQPVVDRVVTPSEVPEAYAALEAGTQFGKLVVDWRP